MSLGSRAGVAAPLPGPLTGLQSLMMDEHCPLAGLTSDQCQTTADACSTPPAQLGSARPSNPSLTERAAGIKPSQRGGKNTVGHGEGAGRGMYFFLPTPLAYFGCRNDIKRVSDCIFGLLWPRFLSSPSLCLFKRSNMDSES